MELRFFLDWFNGSSAVVDIQGDASKQTRYLLRYTSPFRPTMRSPHLALPAPAADFTRLNSDLNALASRWTGDRPRGGPGEQSHSAEGNELVELSRQLFSMALLPHVRTDLRRTELFLELGTDETLLHLPWELMHDGDDFLCLKHSVGRYVNLRKTPELQARSLLEAGTEFANLRVLLIAVPQPKPHGKHVFQRLAAVELERDAIVAMLAKLGVRVEVLDGTSATRMSVLSALRGDYQIIHFSGHAFFDATDTDGISLVLDDGLVSVGSLTSEMSEQRAVLCVVNACETARSAGGSVSAAPLSWEEQFNTYGLARAFLENGAYVLGSRWKLPDEAGQRFASTFYESFLGNGAPVGRAIKEARKAVKAAAPAGDLAWASYVYYGDPRLCIRPMPSAPREGQAPVDGERTYAPQPTALGVPTELAPADTSETAEGGGRSAAAGLVDEALRSLQRTMTVTGASESADALSRAAGDLMATVPRYDVSSVIEKLDPSLETDRTAILALLEVYPDPDRFATVSSVIAHPANPLEDSRALRAASRMLPNLTDEQRSTLRSLLRDRAYEPDLLGTERLLLISDLRVRLGDSGLGNPDFE